MLQAAAQPEAPLAVSGQEGSSIHQREFILALVALVLGRQVEVAHD